MYLDPEAQVHGSVKLGAVLSRSRSRALFPTGLTRGVVHGGSRYDACGQVLFQALSVQPLVCTPPFFFFLLSLHDSPAQKHPCAKCGHTGGQLWLWSWYLNVGPSPAPKDSKYSHGASTDHEVRTVQERL